MMKKMLMMMAVLAGMTFSSCSAKDLITQDITVLPEKAQVFIRDYFRNLSVDWVKADKEFMERTTYEVLFTDGTKIDFDSKGEWKDIEVRRMNAVPDSLVPDYARGVIAARYDGQHVVSIDRGRRSVEIELSNGLSLKFNKKGELIEIDD